MPDNRPAGRKRNITGTGSGAFKTGGGLGTGPVGGGPHLGGGIPGGGIPGGPNTRLTVPGGDADAEAVSALELYY